VERQDLSVRMSRDMLSPMDLYDRVFGPTGLRRFGDPIDGMRDVRDNTDLEQLRVDGKGFILNLREDRKMLHRARCEAIQAMVSPAYPKVFFASEESLRWLDATLGKHGWIDCGKCGGSKC
jgi:hypothetical protein